MVLWPPPSWLALTRSRPCVLSINKISILLITPLSILLEYGEIYHKVFDKILTFLSNKFTLIKFLLQQISTISPLNIKVAHVATCNMMPSVFFFKKATKKAYSLVIRAMTIVLSLYHPFVFGEKDEKLTCFLMFGVRDVFVTRAKNVILAQISL